MVVVKRNTYSKWENMINDMKLEKSNELANYYETSLDYLLGFPQTTYSQYEVGTAIPTTLKLLVVAIYYNISLDYLTGRSDDKEIR